MAPTPKATSYPVSVQKSAAGDYLLGFELDGEFVQVTGIMGVYADAKVAKAKQIAKSKPPAEESEE